MLKKLVMLAVLTFGFAAVVPQDIPWPSCDPCSNVR
jgi:hypothetical protein